MVDYMEREAHAHATPWPAIARHMLGLRHGLRGARRWRQVWSDHHLKDTPPRTVMAMARAAAQAAAEVPGPAQTAPDSQSPCTAAPGVVANFSA